jgi:type IV secretory pathway VirJ component
MVRRRRRLLSIFIAAASVLTAVLVGVLLVGGYFENQPYMLEKPDHGQHSRIAAVYWSGDMGMRLGGGSAIVEHLRERGIPVLTVSTPMLFGSHRDRAYVDRTVAESVRLALKQSGAQQVALIGNSFGADMIATGLGRIAPDLRSRVASVVLVVPGNEVYFHANPTGIFYYGLSDADPAHTVPLLKGLPVTCIFGTEEASSLCREPVMATARRVAIGDGHLMLASRDYLAAAVLRAVEHPPYSLR